MQDSACSPQNCSPQPERHTTCMCGHSFLLATFIFYADKFLMLQHSACANYLDSHLICPYACCVFTYGLNKFGLIFFCLFAFWFWFLVFVVVFCFSFCFFPRDPCSPGSPGTHSADHAGLELGDSPASASPSAEIKSVCYPHPAINLVLINVCCICCGIVVGLLLFCVVCFACLVSWGFFVCLFLCF